jgi:hypothetical protein
MKMGLLFCAFKQRIDVPRLAIAAEFVGDFIIFFMIIVKLWEIAHMN